MAETDNKRVQIELGAPLAMAARAIDSDGVAAIAQPAEGVERYFHQCTVESFGRRSEDYLLANLTFISSTLSPGRSRL